MNDIKVIFMTSEDLELLADKLQLISSEVKVSVHNRRVCVVTLRGDNVNGDVFRILNLMRGEDFANNALFEQTEIVNEADNEADNE
jgi:hypothetical protein